MRLVAYAAIYEALIVKAGKDAKKARVIKAQEEATEACRIARELYQEWMKESKIE
jgi:hypothetical protein